MRLTEVRMLKVKTRPHWLPGKGALAPEALNRPPEALLVLDGT